MGARPSGPGCSPARREAAASRSGMLRVCGQASLSSSITAFVSGWAVVTPVPWPPRHSSATPAVRSGLAVTGLAAEAAPERKPESSDGRAVVDTKRLADDSAPLSSGGGHGPHFPETDSEPPGGG